MSLLTSSPLSAARIAEALGVSKETVRRRASQEGWQASQRGNRTEYLPPDEVVLACDRDAAPDGEAEPVTVRFVDLADAGQRAKVLLREEAVLQLAELCRGRGREEALQLTCTMFAGRGLNISTRSLRRWEADYAAHGIDGLVEQKQGRVGPRGCAEHLTTIQLQRARAAALEHGSIAKGARLLAADPELSHEVRKHLHGAHASKSYVTPSIAAALRTAPLTASLLQGPRAARLAGAFTPGAYDQLRAGEWFTSDDMTSNVYCWVEAPNAKGWRIAQAQILPVIDIATLRWLTVRVILREGGQYSSDDIWGLFGDVFDTFGLPARGFLLEGGHWASNRIKGHRTGLTDDERIGGLKSLGLDVRRSYDPRSKHIEQCFNQLQYWFDRCPGYAGRDQRKQMPEQLKKQLAACEGGHNHPREFILHCSAFADRLQGVMEQMNNERNDGVILRGQSPLEKWADHEPALTLLPEEAKWLYRSQASAVLVSRNGFRVTLGSGAKQLVHYYDNPALTVPLRGRRVWVYWNDHSPESDASILDFTTRKHLGSAQWVRPVERFAGTDEQLAAEAKRKAAHMQVARTEARAMQPELQRKARPVVAVDPTTARIYADLTAAAERTEAEAAQRKADARKTRDLGPAAAADLLASDAPQPPATVAAELMDTAEPEPIAPPERRRAPDLLAELSQ